MWPFMSYQEYSPSDVGGKTYDYVVVGAGCVLASRLSEDHDVSILLIERGHVKDNLISRMPLLSQNMFWTDTLQVQSTIWSEPISGAYGRRNRLWAVNGLGGASRLNAMLWTRGSPRNYTEWSEMGLTDWTWDRVQPYFQRLENLAETKVLDEPQSEVRSHLKEAATKVGLPILDDCNNPNTAPSGCFALETAIDKKGRRVSALTAYLGKSVFRERIKRLTICTGAVASRLEIDGDDRTGHVATGVHMRPSIAVPGDKSYLVKARREVIICCGAMTTPQLLLLSGIGPRRKSSAESRLNIPLVKDLPAVGAGFSDHYAIPIMLDFPHEETFHFLESTIWGLWHILLWIFTGTGMMSLSAAPTAIFLHTDSIDEKTMQFIPPGAQDPPHDCQAPDVEIMVIPLNSLERPVPGRALFSIYPTVLQPRATGCLEITSTDPLVNPKITYPMFGREADLKTARLAVRFSMRLAAEFQKLYPFHAPFAFAPGNGMEDLAEWEKAGSVNEPSVVRTARGLTPTNKTWESVTDEEIDDYMRRVGHTALHFSSTCPMGTSEETAVVDQELLVFGFKNLRLADAIVLPKITSAHTMAPVMMVAERCADFIRRTWNTSQA
ncbi:GMC oxidoreductase [Amniculicola lignicola CBS 123094]|uniref:GMC oxidoreductase n=1 Tax=Amniculicola lignicola CBS 123094 TaxID=1392246 RepID=A0A6A5WTT1_9PLEO|nr:GMC oxidoreductase [Amniculicola lignicola CBS 123094]